MSTVVGLNPASAKCPGLEWRTRSGIDVPIWIPPKRAVKAGYLPKSVTLSPSLSTVELAAVCRRLQAEVLEYMTGGDHSQAAVYDGSFTSLANIFMTHTLSPFIIPKRLTWKVKRNMAMDIATILKEIGGRQLHAIKAEDGQIWYDTFKAPVMQVQVGTSLSRVGVERLAQARRFITLIRTMLRFGAKIDINPDLTIHCKRLADKEFGALSIVRCEAPVVRVAEVSFDMVEGLCDLARGYGYYSVALSLAVQFETGLRQLDTIGEYEPQEEGALAPAHGLFRKGRQRSNLKKNYLWKHGIVWGANIDKNLILTKLTSKSKFKKMAKFNLNLCPMVMKELAFVPLDRRIGPLIIQEGGLTAGMPWSREYFSSVCKNLIAEMAVTDERFVGVTNMDMRSGAISEAFDGVDEDSTAAGNVQKLYGQHATGKQTAHYNRATLAKSEVISERRVATREARRLADSIGAGRIVD